MRDLPIAYGNSRHEKHWVNKTIRYEDLKERLRVTIRTTESAEEYAGMVKGRRDNIKDHGGFVAGVLAQGRRKTETVMSRSMGALDGDWITKEFLEDLEKNVPYTCCLYSTHSSTPEEPRGRMIFPFTRDVTPEECSTISVGKEMKKLIEKLYKAVYGDGRFISMSSEAKRTIDRFMDLQW